MRANLALLLGIAERLAARGNDRAALAELMRETRRIQGTAESFGFLDASRLAAGMEATVRDWASRPDDQDVDHGSLTLWFVTRLATMLKLEMPRRAAAPRAKPAGALAPRRTAGIPTPPSAPVAPSPPKVPAPTPAPTRRLIIRRPSAARPSPEPPAPIATPPPAPPAAAPPTRAQARSAHPPPGPPSPAPPRIDKTQELIWPIPPEEAAGSAAAAESLSAPPPTPEPQPVLAAPPVEPPAPEAPPAAAPPTPEPQRILAVTPVEPPAREPPPPAVPPMPEPQSILAAPPVEPPAPEAPPQPIDAAPSAAPDTEVAATVAEVIFVEDDAALAELLEYGLQSRGYRFLSYRNGREALRELLALDMKGTRPLLLLDVDLPGLDGYSIFDALQRERPGTYRVVFTTVHGTEEEQLRGLEAGALDYMVKPISLRVALEKIKRWVGR
ncbi:MAG TPA: response regulator [Gemmatimonadales bacterium]|nr:response regulator [Gemmatimonadales bacterium]